MLSRDIRNRLLLLAAAGLLAVPVAADTIYRWVDEDGRVHFSAYPPEDQEAETVEPQISSGIGDAGAAAASRETYDVGEGDEEVTEEQAAKEAHRAAEEAARRAEEQARAEYSRLVCQDARERLARLQAANPRTRFPMPDGTVRPYTPQEIDAMVAEDQAAIREHCR
jgi:hypothetical protein